MGRLEIFIDGPYPFAALVVRSLSRLLFLILDASGLLRTDQLRNRHPMHFKLSNRTLRVGSRREFRRRSRVISNLATLSRLRCTVKPVATTAFSDPELCIRQSGAFNALASTYVWSWRVQQCRQLPSERNLNPQKSPQKVRRSAPSADARAGSDAVFTMSAAASLVAEAFHLYFLAWKVKSAGNGRPLK